MTSTSSKSTELLQKLMGTLDDEKEKISSESYKNMSEILGKLFKEKESKLYQITYIQTRIKMISNNDFYTVPSKCVQIIKLTDDEHRILLEQLRKTNNYAVACCHIVLNGISDRLNHNKINTIYGRYNGDIGEDDDDIIGVTIDNNVMFTSCRKV